MRRYASTYLSTDTLQMEIPEQIYHLGGYGRSQKLTISIAQLTKDDQIILDRCDRFSVHLAPFTPKDLEQIFFVEVSIESRPNTLARVLEFFKAHQIDILECRSVDRRLPAGGLVELIISVKDKSILGGGDPGRHPQVLKEKLLNHLGYVHRESFIGDALIDLAVSIWSRLSTLVGHSAIDDLKNEFASYSGDSSSPQKEVKILQRIANIIPAVPLSEAFQPHDFEDEILEIRREIREAFRRVTAGPYDRLKATGEIPRWEFEESAITGEANSRVLQEDEHLWNSIRIVKPLPEESIKHLTTISSPGEHFNGNIDTRRLIERVAQPFGNSRIVFKLDAAGGIMPVLDSAGEVVPQPERFFVKLNQEADNEVIGKLRQCPRHNYVSLIFDDQANLLQAIFKDPSEIIVRFLTILRNIPGQLERIVSPLGKIGVDLRLINPLSPVQIPEHWDREYSNHIPYEIIANVDNTKLRLFEQKSMLAIVKAEIFNGTSRESARRDVPFIQIMDIQMNEEKLENISLNVLSSQLIERKPLRPEAPEVSDGSSGAKNDVSWMLVPSDGEAGGSFGIRFLSGPLFRNTRTALLHLEIEVPKEAVRFHLSLGRDSLLELLRNVFVDQLDKLKDESVSEEEYPRRLGSEFLAAASDAIHGVRLVASCADLCEKIESMSNGTNVADVRSGIGSILTIGFRDLKFGLLPLLEGRPWIYVAEPGTAPRFRHEDDLIRCRQSVNRLLAALENFVEPINEKSKMPEPEVCNELKGAAAEIQNILYPPYPEKPVHERINEHRGLRERTRSQ